MKAFVFTVLIVVAAADTRDKRGLLVSPASLHPAPLLASPYLSPYGTAPLLSSHALHSPLLGAHSLYSAPYLASSLYSPLYSSYYSPSIHAPILTSNALLSSHGPLLTSLSSPLIATHAHSTPIITTHHSPAVTVVKTSSVVHSNLGHLKH